ncbi:hypothetical protein C9374_002264 [Naegleria lovaniensis]|uniref:Uncharacterized protein n=1 Tax=Naegleria lovaniensis TaxID=51637 RepID=A0AA88GTD0_NAELO|nr:uncharacterized protein C9374_002264 [Naegleria lovaniensis]KAG2386520.1 hypothetical protein C9374_002264 [Naegleria lovaniensis]
MSHTHHHAGIVDSNTSPSTDYYNVDVENHHPANRQKETPWTKFKKYWKKFSSKTIGNRRLKMCIYSILKFFSITYVQANNIFGGEALHLSEREKQLSLSFKIISYMFMAVLILLFIERYFRELISIVRKKPLQTWINWMESLIYLIYFIFSIMTAITHIVFIVREYNHEVEEREKNPEEFAKRKATLEQVLSVEIIEVLIHFYIIVDKGTHFLHAGHSVSIYLEKAQHIPKHAHYGHDHGHLPHGEDGHDHPHNSSQERLNHYEHSKQESESDEEYDDYIGRTKSQTKNRRHTSAAVTSRSSDAFDRL